MALPGSLHSFGQSAQGTAPPTPTSATTGFFRGERQRLEPISNSNEGEKCPVKSTQRAARRKWELFRLPESRQVTRTGAGVGLSTQFHGQVIKMTFICSKKSLPVAIPGRCHSSYRGRTLSIISLILFIQWSAAVSPHWNKLRGHTQQFTSSEAKIRLSLHSPENPGLSTEELSGVSIPALTQNTFIPTTPLLPHLEAGSLLRGISMSINLLSTFQ